MSDLYFNINRKFKIKSLNFIFMKNEKIGSKTKFFQKISIYEQ